MQAVQYLQTLGVLRVLKVCNNANLQNCKIAGLLDRPVVRTSWTDQLDRSSGRTSSLYLKPWPVRIFEDSPFSLYIVAASESDEGLVVFDSFGKLCNFMHMSYLVFL